MNGRFTPRGARSEGRLGEERRVRSVETDVSGDWRREEQLGVTLALALAAPAFVASVLFIFRVAVSPVTLLVTVVGGGAWGWRSFGRDRGVVLGVAGAVIVVSMTIAAQFFDVTFDGQTYHQAAVRALAAGWNPVWEARWAGGTAFPVLVGGLPKAAWVWEAMVYRATGSLEAAKGARLIALVAAFLLALAAFEAWGVGRRKAIVAAALAAANPIALTQLLSFYLDGLVVCGVIIVAALAVLWWKSPSWTTGSVLAVVAAFTANLKFPALVYVAMIAMAVAGITAYGARDRLRAVAGVFTLAACLAIVEGINPYVTNTILHGNPAYPAAGPNARPLLVYREPVFLAQSRLVQLARSVFSRSSNDEQTPPRAKLPFTIHADELGAFTTVDTRFGGWGPLFGGALIVAGLIVAIGVATRRAGAGALALLTGAVALSALVIPFGAYARYSPQLWLVCLPALFVRDARPVLVRFLVFILAANTALVGGVSLGSQLLDEHLQRRQLTQLAADAGGAAIAVNYGEAPFVNADLHFAAYGIRYGVVDAPRCAAPARLLRTQATMCLAGDRSPAPVPDPAAAAAPLLKFVGLR